MNILLMAVAVLINSFAYADFCPAPDYNQTISSVETSSRWEFFVLTSSLIAGKALEIGLLSLKQPKPFARAFGKVLKSLHNRKNALDVIASGVSSCGGVVFSQQLLKHQQSLILLNGVTASLVAAEYALRPTVMSTLFDVRLSQTWEAAYNWFIGPIMLKTSSVSVRYALEKRIQEYLKVLVKPMQIKKWIAHHTFFSKTSTERLANAVVVGSSKIASATLASSVIAVIDIGIDAIQEDPQWQTITERVLKYLRDTGVAIGSTFVISIVMPVTLVSTTPRYLTVMFVVGNTLHWVLFS